MRTICTIHRDHIAALLVDSGECILAHETFRDFGELDEKLASSDLWSTLADVPLIRREFARLRVAPWEAEVTMGICGLPVQLPERLIGRRVKITISDLGPGE